LGRAEPAQRHEEHAPVVLAPENLPWLRRHHVEAQVMAIAILEDGVGVLGEDMEAENQRRARESATTLRAAAWRERTHAPVVDHLDAGGVGMAPKGAVGAGVPPDQGVAAGYQCAATPCGTSLRILPPMIRAVGYQCVANACCPAQVILAPMIRDQALFREQTLRLCLP